MFIKYTDKIVKMAYFCVFLFLIFSEFQYLHGQNKPRKKKADSEMLR